MQAAIKRMGNSAAILLPKPVLAHLQVAAGDVLELELEDGRVVLSAPPLHPRSGWAEAAKVLADAREDRLEWPDLDDAADETWVW